MSDELKRYLEDVLHCIKMIEKFKAGVQSFQEYEKNELLKSAVQWQIPVIGEALNNALKLDSALVLAMRVK